MHVPHIIDKDKTSHPKTRTPLNWLLGIFSLGSNQSGKCFLIIKMIVLAVTLGSLNFFTLHCKIKYLYKNLSPSIKFTDIIQMIYDYFQYLVDLFSIYKYGTHVSKQYYKQYENIDKILATVNHCAIKSRLVRLIGIFAFIWLSTSICDFSAWFLSYGWKAPLIFSPAYLFLLIKILTTLDLTSNVIEVEYRLRVIGDLVHNCYECAESLPTAETVMDCLGDSINNKNWFYSDGCSRIKKWSNRTHPLKLMPNCQFEMKWLTRCYLMLTEQCTFINTMFGGRIVLNSLSLLIDMVRYANVAVRIAVGSQHTTYDSGYFPAFSSLFRMLTCAAVLTSLVYHCEQTYGQADRIVRIIDHLLINRNPNAEMRAASTELRCLVLSRPISFSMAKFFRLSYTFLVSTASVAVTYTIILLQSMN